MREGRGEGTRDSWRGKAKGRRRGERGITAERHTERPLKDEETGDRENLITERERDCGAQSGAGLIGLRFTWRRGTGQGIKITQLFCGFAYVHMDEG